MALDSFLSPLFESKTISPSYKLPHVVFTIFLLGKSKEGIGRYRIKDETGLGEGSIKTLLARLKEEGMINVEEKRQSGHILSPKGKLLLNTIGEYMSAPVQIENPKDRYVVGNAAAFSILKQNHVKSINKIGIAQRDEAIKIGGTGASCLIFDGMKFIFPDQVSLTIPVAMESLTKGDLIIIGGGDTLNKAIIATIAAALSIMDLSRNK